VAPGSGISWPRVNHDLEGVLAGRGREVGRQTKVDRHWRPVRHDLDEHLPIDVQRPRQPIIEDLAACSARELNLGGDRKGPDRHGHRARATRGEIDIETDPRLLGCDGLPLSRLALPEVEHQVTGRSGNGQRDS
jgi:hypothetical protein